MMFTVRLFESFEDECFYTYVATFVPHKNEFLDINGRGYKVKMVEYAFDIDGSSIVGTVLVDLLVEKKTSLEEEREGR